MTTAAMARTKSGEQPCVERRPSLWYGGTIGNWRDCLEALSAGDFLTPVSIGLVFRGTVRFGWWEDRATALERSWEERFSQLAGSDTDKWPEQCPGDLRCPFMTSRPQESHWIPLLVLNGVSSATGRRILTTVLASDYHPKATCPVAGAMKTDANIKATAAQIFKSAVSGPARQCAIFLESVRFHDLLANKNPPNWLGRIQRLAVWDYVRNKLPFLTPRNLDDIRLSTAAHNSARFPIVSPAGEIRNDGGYFENYGALGAMELAQAIRAIEPKLAPFVLVISNDPDEDPDLTKVDVADDAVLADVSVPIAAVVNTRTSRGRLAVGQLEAAMESVAEPDCGGGTAHIRVWPRFQQTANGDLENVSRPISMSWWLSRPIQILLHQQTEENKNQNKNPDQIERVWRAIMSKSDCPTCGCAAYFLLLGSGFAFSCVSSSASLLTVDLSVAISARAAARSRLAVVILSWVSRASLTSACCRNSILDCRHPVRRSICFSAVQTSKPRMSCAATGDSRTTKKTPPKRKNCVPEGHVRRHGRCCSGVMAESLHDNGPARALPIRWCEPVRCPVQSFGGSE